MNNGIVLDDSGVRDMLDALSTREVMGIQRTALRKAANVLRADARKRLRKDLPSSTTNSGKYSDTLVQGIMTSVTEGNEGMDAKVHIMGTRKQTSGTFRTRFFEGGTKVRKTKKGYNRGKIKALYFFKDAVSATKDKVQSTLDKELSKTIQKIADQQYG